MNRTPRSTATQAPGALRGHPRQVTSMRGKPRFIYFSNKTS